MHGIRSGHLECSSAVRRAPAAPKEEEQGENWNLIVIVNGYNAQSGSTTELLAANLCEASYGAEKKSLIVVLESNIGSGSVEPVERRASEEPRRLIAWCNRIVSTAVSFRAIPWLAIPWVA